MSKEITIAVIAIVAILIIGYEYYAATSRKWGENTSSLLEYFKQIFQKGSA
ncbi:MAG: hypothetical protein PHO62_07685 [Sulfurimonas sp.]|uniref:hypothetical protein n=1 Tax=Sulfurimonas sp. TaxID=2022749 RepID=UPI00260D12EF|nr:hypothetical protein [Sulfurimonas sp.]MDD5373287.1 hypothetical protein [Sulfurimonas sp.]